MSAKAKLQLVVLLDNELIAASRLLHGWSDLVDARVAADKGKPEEEAQAPSEAEVLAAYAALNASYVALFHVNLLKGAAIVVAHMAAGCLITYALTVAVLVYHVRRRTTTNNDCVHCVCACDPCRGCGAGRPFSKRLNAPMARPLASAGVMERLERLSAEKARKEGW